MYTQVMGRAPSSECSLRKMVESSQDRKISVSPIPITGYPPETPPRGYLGKSLKKWSYFSQCDLNRKVKRIFMIESSFPKYILHRNWYTREKLSKILQKIWFSGDIVLLTLYYFLKFNVCKFQTMANCPLYISNPGAHSNDGSFPSLIL